MCDIYPRRPHICRELAETDCEVNSTDEGQYFYSPAEYLEYLKTKRKKIFAALRKRYLPPEKSWSGEELRSRRPASFRKQLQRLRLAGFSAGRR
jgi:hypothetical protein